MRNSFPCTGCGACCKSDRLSELTHGLERGDGICIHFDDGQNGCKIYENRPDICNVEKTYDQHYKSVIQWNDFVSLNMLACNELLKQQADLSKMQR